MRAAAVRKVLRRFGYDVVRYDARHSAELRRQTLLASRRVDLALDVGANDGSYGAALRSAGFKGRIASFEPQRGAFDRLASRAAGDPLWTAERVAVGGASRSVKLNVAANSSSSSVLPIAERHVAAAPESATVGVEEVRMIDLDAADVLEAGERVFLKIDVQGYELEVLRGAERTLSQVVLLETELSLVSLYAGAPLLPEVVTYVTERGFALAGLDPVLVDPADGSLLQVDAVFVRT